MFREMIVQSSKSIADPSTNFRVRMAGVKRTRMRARLLSATMEVCSVESARGPAVIDDVVRAAGVSRGTFYKYFESLEKAVVELGDQLADESIETMNAMYGRQFDPVDRTAAGLLLMMIHAIADPIWGRFVAHTDHLASESVLMKAIRSNTVAAQRKRAFTFLSLQGAIDLQFGVTREGVKRVLTPFKRREAYMLDLTVMTLRALGVDHAKAQQTSRSVADDAVERGPTFLPWWKPFRI